MKITMMTDDAGHVACVFNGSLGYGDSLAQAVASCNVTSIYRIGQDRCIAQVGDALVCITGNHAEGATVKTVANVHGLKAALAIA